MLVFVLFIAGCGTKQQAQDTTEPPAPQVAVVDMNKAIKAHPKYNQLMALGQQADTIAAQLEAQQLAGTRQTAVAAIPNPNMTDNQLAELNKASSQEFSAKMAAKQDELTPRIAAKAETVRATLSNEMNAYTEQLDKEYKPQIFNLQLKLKTVQLTKEETTGLQAELEKLQNQRSDALKVKHDQLAGRMDELVAPEKAAVEQQLAAYAKELNVEISQKAATKQAEIVARANEQQLPATGVSQPDQPSNDMAPLTAKKQEIQALQESIIADITDKTSKVAIDGGFAAVLTNVTVNVSAVDITTQVIAECNK